MTNMEFVVCIIAGTLIVVCFNTEAILNELRDIYMVLTQIKKNL